MLIDANIFQPLIDVFAAVLKFFHNDIGVSWGLSIVLLTFVVRLALVPIGIKQFHSMQRMALHAPEMKKLREKYKDNKERLQSETMKFYKDNNVNPFASCLPLLIQWPFLIGLFWTLRGNLRDDICLPVQKAYRAHLMAVHHLSAAAVSGQTKACGTPAAKFLFIHDLTNSPHGVEVVILLLLYIGTSVGSSMIMMMPGTELNQRRMMLVLPVVFAFITIRFPAGALLYYIIFNLWMVTQQSVFKKLIGQQYRQPQGAVIGLPGGGSAGSGGGIRELLGLAQRVPDDGGGAAGRNPVPPPRSERAKRTRAGATALAEPKPAKPATNGKPENGKPANGNGNGAGTAKSPNGKSTNGRSANGKSSSGKTPSGNGSNGGSGNGVGHGPPPPSPRKKKKRSGRRR